MRITKVKLFNYSSYYDREAIELKLGPGINFIIGQNNAGKTKLLDMLTLDARGDRTNNLHRRDYANIPMTDADLGFSRYDIELHFERNEIANLVLSETDIVYVPASMDQTSYEVMPSSGEMMQLVQNPQQLRLRISQDLPDFVQVVDTEYNIHFHVEPLTFRCLAFEQGSCTSELVLCEAKSWQLVSDHETCWHILYSQALRNRICRIDSDFRISLQSNSKIATLLKSDASNLVNALRTLNCHYPEVFTEYLARVRQVIPSIRDLVFDYDGEHVMLRVSEETSNLRDSELGMLLAECGTGVGRVLAIMYQVVTMPNPSVILVDEPQAHLHAGASRRLLNVLEEYDHQYIIATHSPTAIMSVEEKTILLVTRENMVSTVRSVAVDDNAQLEAALSELGTRRSDIFGMDAVIWVEGKTDAACFKLILDKAGGLPFGTNIMALVNTGDIEDKKHARLAVNIYRTLSGGVGLLPSALGFVFDGDKEGSHGDIELETGTQVIYLPRQTYENYLLEFPSLIAGLLNEKHEGKSQPYMESQIQEWISDNCRKDKYYRGDAKYDPSTWTRNIDGARFISAMFQELTGKQRPYSKAKFGPILTKRILAKAPDHFQEIVDILKPLLDPDQSEDKPAQT